MNWLASDFYIYFSYAERFYQGLVPYKDYFLEYFPGAFWILLLPRLFTSDFLFYISIFVFLMMILFLVQVVILIKRWGKTKKEKTWLGLLILSSALILPLSLIRLDLPAAIFTLLAVGLFLENRSFLSGLFLAVGTLIKIFPALLLPLFVLYFWLKKERVKAAGMVFIYFLTVVILLAPFVLMGGEKGLFDAVSYHLWRPIQIESLPASVLFLGFFSGKATTIFFDFGSHNIRVLSWDWTVGRAFFVLWPTFLLLTYLWFWRQVRWQKQAKGQEFLLIKTSLMTLLVFIAFSKVFSPQYLIWLFPLVLWFFLYLPRRKMMILGLLWSLILLLTMVNLAKFWDLISLNPAIVFSQILRNLLYLLFLVGIFLTKADEKNTSIPSLN